MPHYASSAPATDEPYKELDDFPSVARISDKVKMNPLAPIFLPALPLLQTASTTAATTSLSSDSSTKALARQLEEPQDHVEETDPYSETAMTEGMQPLYAHGFSDQGEVEEHMMNATFSYDSIHDPPTQLYDPVPAPSQGYEATAIPQEYHPDAIVTRSVYLSAMSTYDNQQNAMLRSHPPAPLERYTEGTSGQVDFNYVHHPRNEYQQNTTPSYPRATPSPFAVLPSQAYTYYPTQLYGRPLPASMYGPSIRTYHNQVPFIPRGPLPPAYPFPHLTPPEPQPGPRRFPLPYDNTAKAIAYLKAFTDLYGSSATSIESLQALCLTLGHLNSETQSLPKTIRGTQNFIKKRFVNIFDLVDYGMRGEVVPAELVFRHAGDLRRYSEDTRKICPASVGREEGAEWGNELWRWMLRKWY